MPATLPPFVPFGTAHWIALLVLVAGGFFVIGPLGVRASARVRRRTAIGLVVVLLIGEAGMHVYDAARGIWSLQTSLPLDMCTLGIFVTAHALLTSSRISFEIAFFWHLSGSVHGMITPDIRVGFPEFPFFNTFIEHGVSLIGVLFVMATTSLRPSWASILRVFLFSLALLPLVALVNWAIDANYFFMREKPHGDNLTSILPGWPWYFLLLIPIALGHYVVIYLVYLGLFRRRAAATRA